MSNRNRLASLLLLTSMLLAVIVSACGPAQPATTQQQATAAPTTAPAEPWAPLKESDFTSAKIDWQAPAKAGPAEGITLHVAALSHPYINALRPYVPLFEKLTGVKVAYDVLPVEEFWVKTAADLSGKTGFYDLVQTGTEFEWGWAEAGWIEDLNPYLQNTALTDQAWYNVSDFFPYDWAAHAWNGKYGTGTYGQGRQNAIPVNAEPLMLICNKKLLEEAGLSAPPKTWTDWADYAKKMTVNGHYGVVQRGARDYSLMYGYAPGFFAYGGADLDANGKPAYNSPAGVEYTQLYGDTLRQYGPPGQTNIGWDSVVGNMAAGTAGCTVDDMAFADTYENPAKTKFAGQFVYSNPPAGPGGEIKIPVWYWAWSINSNSSRKDAAWLFLEWATSSQVMTVVSAEQHAMIPVRKSVWESDNMRAITASWGNYREAVDASRQYWGNFYTVSPNMVAETGPWVDAIQSVILGDKTAQEALDEAAAKTEKVLQDAGFYQKFGN